jgi:hypothetical protein
MGVAIICTGKSGKQKVESRNRECATGGFHFCFLLSTFLLFSAGGGADWRMGRRRGGPGRRSFSGGGGVLGLAAGDEQAGEVIGEVGGGAGGDDGAGMGEWVFGSDVHGVLSRELRE